MSQSQSLASSMAAPPATAPAAYHQQQPRLPTPPPARPQLAVNTTLYEPQSRQQHLPVSYTGYNSPYNGVLPYARIAAPCPPPAANSVCYRYPMLQYQPPVVTPAFTVYVQAHDVSQIAPPVSPAPPVSYRVSGNVSSQQDDSCGFGIPSRSHGYAGRSNLYEG